MRPRHKSSPDRRRPSPSRRSRISAASISGAPGPPPPGMAYGPPPPPHMMPPPPPHMGPPFYPPPHPYGGRGGFYGPPSPPEDPEPEEDKPTPICRCRVLYLGSAVPHVTKDGLQGIQEPLRELYPEEGATGAKGIDSWLSVWSNGFLLENVDENRKKVTRFFPVESLHYCAAVRYVLVPGAAAAAAAANNSPGGGGGGGANEQVQRFLPLDSPFARNPSVAHPPLFASILRRTTGIKVLECHVFICKREAAANALVRCAFHAYADSTYAKHLETGGGAQSIYGTIGGGPQTPVPSSAMGGHAANGAATINMGPETPTPGAMPHNNNSSVGPSASSTAREFQQSVIEVSEDSINSIEKVEEWKVLANGNNSSPSNKSKVPNGTPSPRENGNGTSPDEISVVNGDENHKVWTTTRGPGGGRGGADTTDGAVGANASTSENPYADYGSTMRSFRSSASGLSHRNRPRQMMMPSSPPPPPIPEELKEAEGATSSPKKEKKRKQRRSKSREAAAAAAAEHHHHMMMMSMNGEVPRGGGSHSMVDGPTSSRKHSVSSASGPLPPPPHMRMNGHGPPQGRHGPPMMPPPHPMMMGGGTLPPKKSGTFSGRKSKSSSRAMPPPFMMYPPANPYAYGPPGPGGPYGPPPPPHLMPPPGHPIYNMPSPGRPMEEPIYMPHAARPMSPVASYQPGHFPHEAYYSQQPHHPQQFATIDKSNRYRKSRPPSSSRGGDRDRSSKHQSSDSAAGDADDSDLNQAAGNGGLYSKKGHINERAFSYSIRNEHRSRSHGSLNTGGGGSTAAPYSGEDDDEDETDRGGRRGRRSASRGSRNRPNGDVVNNNGHGPPMMMEGNGGPGPDDQRMAHMMSDLELAEDRIERSEVPPGMWGGPGATGPMLYGAPPPHHNMMMMPDPVAAAAHHNHNGKKKR